MSTPDKWGKCGTCIYCEDIGDYSYDGYESCFRKCKKAGHDYIDTVEHYCSDYVFDGHTELLPENYRKTYGAESGTSYATSESDFGCLTGILWLLLSLAMPLAGIAAGIFHFCRKNKRIALGVFCIIFSLVSALVGGTFGYAYFFTDKFKDRPSVLEPDNGYFENHDTSDVTSDTYVFETEPISETDNNVDANETEAPPAVDKSVMYIDADGGLNLRSGPGTQNDIVVLMDDNASVKVIRTENNWAYVEYNGYSGWCSMDYLVYDVSDHAALDENTAWRLIEEHNYTWLLYYFGNYRGEDLVDRNNVYYLVLDEASDYKVECYAVKGINTVDDLKEKLKITYTDTYIDSNIINKADGFKSGMWFEANGTIYFAPNYGAGHYGMWRETMTIERMSTRVYQVKAKGGVPDGENSGYTVYNIVYDDGVYKINNVTYEE